MRKPSLSLSVVPNSMRGMPSLIESFWPVQKISIEAQKERKSGPGQSLTATGSYWKGRKPLVLVRACILGALLPATDDHEKDLAVFELLMGISNSQIAARIKISPTQDEIERFGSRQQQEVLLKVNNNKRNTKEDKTSRIEAMAGVLALVPYQKRIDKLFRPEEIDEANLYFEHINTINLHLGTNADSVDEIVRQLGIMRFGHRPRVGDTFCGGGSIPFEAARLGCEAFASDLNPVAAMLTWAAFNLVGKDKLCQSEFQSSQRNFLDNVDVQLKDLGVEFDDEGNRAKTYLYCLETRCPQTGWLVPISATWLISGKRNVIARLKPNHDEKRFDIEICTSVTDEEAASAKTGTLQGRDLIYDLDGQTYRISMAELRGDYNKGRGQSGNTLRRWTKEDFQPRPEDVFQERLYCIQWITRDTLDKPRHKTFFRGVTPEDIKREKVVEDIVRSRITEWQNSGLIPDMEIEPGDNTSQPMRERGWTYWHHLFSKRHLLTMSLIAQAPAVDPRMIVSFSGTLDFVSKLTRWVNSGRDTGGSEFTTNVFSNQALNTLSNWGEAAFLRTRESFIVATKSFPIESKVDIVTRDAKDVSEICDIWVTDPPYADAINYHEITEYFIAWLRKTAPSPFNEWLWDSRRPLAIKGEGEEFRKSMVAAYTAMAINMPDNGIQIVMFTHQDAGVWADMAQIFWGSGLQVKAAWYIATETSSDLKKGGYVQGTVILVLCKRGQAENGYKDEVVQEVRVEVAEQIDTMVGLNQNLKGQGRIENLFEDADLQMAGYAAALRILTRYTKIDGVDMTKEALRPRVRGERGLVPDIIDFAVQVANEHMVPEGMNAKVWEHLTGVERFYFKMMDVETTGAKKLDNYQNFAKAFRVSDYDVLMASMIPNEARLRRAKDFKKGGFEIREFGPSSTRAVLFALYELQAEIEGDIVLSHLKDLVPGYLAAREDIIAITTYIGRKREGVDEGEHRAAGILYGLIRNERLG
ncbi:anti-phage-associated DUF1156 domain-containing protein [Methylobacterium sp. E-016]|uniref:anti-phage-associated DUF1156 domain-containing protein n=1 Tax=Methylobacterium sp. E-016 TaxID=2836556 RepID=UPI001FBA4B61|nr:anti-phage-associated DUF1156 domain-containing protein [Methylobacterium sp. E-016]